MNMLIDLMRFSQLVNVQVNLLTKGLLKRHLAPSVNHLRNGRKFCPHILAPILDPENYEITNIHCIKLLHLGLICYEIIFHGISNYHKLRAHLEFILLILA